jgi:hypothetical protein
LEIEGVINKIWSNGGDWEYKDMEYMKDGNLKNYGNKSIEMMRKLKDNLF